MAFKIEMVSPSHASVSLYGVVGWDITDAEVGDQLDTLDVESMDLRINSPGGDVFQGLSIYHRLSEHKAVKTAVVDGLAGSIMSVIMLAAKDREVRKGGRVMIHNPHGYASGSSDDFRAFAEQLDVTRDEVAEIYASHTNLEAQQALELMADETWMTASEAKKYGFATRDSKALAVAACLDGLVVRNFKRVPDGLKQNQDAEASLQWMRRQIELAEARS